MIIETLVFFVASAILIGALYRASKLHWPYKSAQVMFVLALAVIAGQYLVIFKDGSSLSFLAAITPNFSGNRIVQFSSLVMVFLLSFCVPKSR